MNEKDTKRISKFLSLVLRHKPQTIQLNLDEQGWADVDELLEKWAKHRKAITLDQLQYVVTHNDKQRFTFNDDQTKIRANQGHSIDIQLNLDIQTPPETLYHGTATRFLESIFEKGLIKGSRQHVHLSADIETATKVGKRHGKLAILIVQSGKMHEAGFEFYLSKNKVWLTDHVPSKYVTRASSSQ